MPRRSRSSGGSSGGWSAPRPRPRPRPRAAAARAPSSNPPPTPKPASNPPPTPKPAASAAPPIPKHASNPPPTPKPAASAPRPAAVQRESGGFGASIADGLAWGIGSSMGHRAAEAILGPRVVRHETVAAPESAAAATAAPAPNTNSMASSDACGGQSKALMECLNNYQSDISKCQFYMDVLQECRKSSGSVLSA